jgi:hypothetical protein
MNFIQCRGSDSNRHGSRPPQDFKSCASTHSATPAILSIDCFYGETVTFRRFDIRFL